MPRAKPVPRRLTRTTAQSDHLSYAGLLAHELSNHHTLNPPRSTQPRRRQSTSFTGPRPQDFLPLHTGPDSPPSTFSSGLAEETILDGSSPYQRPARLDNNPTNETHPSVRKPPRKETNLSETDDEPLLPSASTRQQQQNRSAKKARHDSPGRNAHATVPEFLLEGSKKTVAFGKGKARGAKAGRNLRLRPRDAAGTGRWTGGGDDDTRKETEVSGGNRLKKRGEGRVMSFGAGRGGCGLIVGPNATIAKKHLRERGVAARRGLRAGRKDGGYAWTLGVGICNAGVGGRRVEIEDVSCLVCGSPDFRDEMAFCDACASACHIECMRPSRKSVPLGIWMCPPCNVTAKRNELHLSRMVPLMAEHQCVECNARGVSKQTACDIACNLCNLSFHRRCLRVYRRISKAQLDQPLWKCNVCAELSPREQMEKSWRKRGSPSREEEMLSQPQVPNNSSYVQADRVRRPGKSLRDTANGEGQCMECSHRQGADVIHENCDVECHRCKDKFHRKCLRRFKKVSKSQLEDPTWQCRTCRTMTELEAFKLRQEKRRLERQKQRERLTSARASTSNTKIGTVHRMEVRDMVRRPSSRQLRLPVGRARLVMKELAYKSNLSNSVKGETRVVDSDCAKATIGTKGVLERNSLPRETRDEFEILDGSNMPAPYEGVKAGELLKGKNAFGNTRVSDSLLLSKTRPNQNTRQPFTSRRSLPSKDARCERPFPCGRGDRVPAISKRPDGKRGTGAQFLSVAALRARGAEIDTEDVGDVDGDIVLDEGPPEVDLLPWESSRKRDECNRTGRPARGCEAAVASGSGKGINVIDVEVGTDCVLVESDTAKPIDVVENDEPVNMADDSNRIPRVAAQHGMHNTPSWDTVQNERSAYSKLPKMRAVRTQPLSPSDSEYGDYEYTCQNIPNGSTIDTNVQSASRFPNASHHGPENPALLKEKTSRAPGSLLTRTGSGTANASRAFSGPSASSALEDGHRNLLWPSNISGNVLPMQSKISRKSFVPRKRLKSVPPHPSLTMQMSRQSAPNLGRSVSPSEQGNEPETADENGWQSRGINGGFC